MLSLQRSGAALAIEHVLTHPRAPLWIALTAPWPWAGFGIATYVLDEKHEGGRLTGFIQLIKRTARPEADVLHVAPAMPVDGPDETLGATIWGRLLEHCVPAAASQGLQRIFVSIPDGGPEETCLKETGFSLYARETIYRLAVAPDAREGALSRTASALPVGFRPQIPPDSWALQRLYTQSTPRLVQQAEGAITGVVGSPALSWWEPDRWVGLAWEPAGEVRGAVQAHLGRAGHWLRLWSAAGATPRERRGLVAEGLRLIADKEKGARPAPIYATVRDYDVGMGGILTGFGFAPYAYRTRFVRHVGATVRNVLPVTFPAVEVGQVLSRSTPEA
jgi:hypothetical protein